MNRILYFKVKKDLKNVDEAKIKEIVLKLQEKFDIRGNSNVFDIEKNISDIEYGKIIEDESFKSMPS